jgi:ribonuclease HI
MSVSIYTDGSLGKGGCGGWAFAAISCDNVITEQVGTEDGTTINRMELTAILRALQWALASNTPEPIIVSDSRYALGAIRMNWPHRAKANQDLVLTGRSLVRLLNPTLQHVRGHSGNRWNDYVDRLAVAARKAPESVYLSPDPAYPLPGLG